MSIAFISNVIFNSCIIIHSMKKTYHSAHYKRIDLSKSVKPGNVIVNTDFSSAKLFLKIGNPKYKKLIIPGYLHSPRKSLPLESKIETEEPPQEPSPIPNQYSDIEQIKNAIFSPPNPSPTIRSFSQRSNYVPTLNLGNPNHEGRLSLGSIKSGHNESEMGSIEQIHASSIDRYERIYERSHTRLENDRDKYINIKQKYEELLEHYTQSKFYYEEEIRRLNLEIKKLKLESFHKYRKSDSDENKILKELQEIKSKLCLKSKII
ncbi:unnamed protein product [Blepharisma stoltei]|uniref:Uncharacterized protein n=1 Tax=Blepharisma stoltei TaxID=1481888 RepID=A0AAU9JLX2_9CILI|nr:unnamed protein product [Blepharisma stoltei]